MAEKQYTVEELRELGVIGEKNTPASTTLTAPTLHGPFPGNAAQYGLFSQPGVRPDRFSTLVRPDDGLMTIITLNRSEYTDEILEVMTGVTADSGTNATGFCGDPPTVGQGKVCEQIYKFSSYLIKTDLNAVPLIGQLRNRADVPANILNGGTEANPLIPDILFQMRDTRSQLAYEFWRIGVSFQRTLTRVLITGDITVASANSEHGWIVEFNGLDLQIKTGYTDAVTGLACAAMDSIVETFGADVASTMADGRNIVQVFSDIYFALKDRARKMQMDGTQWAIVMRAEAFRSITEAYACSYATYRCSGAQYDEISRDPNIINDLRLEMQRGKYLLIDGEAVPVVFSEGIVDGTPASNTHESDVYFVPYNWMGTGLLRLEYYPMDNQYAQEYANFAGQDIVTMNNGMWIVGAEETALCKEYHFANRMRLILETPFLAARLDNVQYTYSAQIRNAYAGASFYANGGTTYRT
jgi:hypothetical protein